MQSRLLRPKNPVAAALYLNAAILFAILLALLRRPGTSELAPQNAFAQPPVMQAPVTQAPVAQVPPITGGSGVFVMPAQFHNDTWGCYLLDVESQTLCTYEYEPGQRELKLTSARDYRNDVLLKDFATEPAPWEVRQMVEQEQQDQRTRQFKTPSSVPQ